MKNYFCQQINKFDTWRKQRPVLSFYLYLRYVFTDIFIDISCVFRNNYKTLLGLGMVRNNFIQHYIIMEIG